MVIWGPENKGIMGKKRKRECGKKGNVERREVRRKGMWEYERKKIREERVCWDTGRMGSMGKEGYRENVGMWEERDVGAKGIWEYGKKGNGKKGNGEEGNVVIWEKGNVS